MESYSEIFSYLNNNPQIHFLCSCNTNCLDKYLIYEGEPIYVEKCNGKNFYLSKESINCVKYFKDKTTKIPDWKQFFGNDYVIIFAKISKILKPILPTNCNTVDECMIFIRDKMNNLYPIILDIMTYYLSFSCQVTIINLKDIIRAYEYSLYNILFYDRFFSDSILNWKKLTDYYIEILYHKPEKNINLHNLLKILKEETKYDINRDIYIEYIHVREFLDYQTLTICNKTNLPREVNNLILQYCKTKYYIRPWFNLSSINLVESNMPYTLKKFFYNKFYNTQLILTNDEIKELISLRLCDINWVWYDKNLLYSDKTDESLFIRC